jgi:hypothetical protein
MTSNKTALTKVVEWANFRKSLGVGSVKRVELQVAAEVANGLELIVLDKETLEEIARQVGGTYVTSTGGKSKIVF